MPGRSHDEQPGRQSRATTAVRERTGTVVSIQAARAPDYDDLILLRIPVTSAIWAEGLPPVPNALIVTVAFSDPEVEAEHAEPLELLGYMSVGCVSQTVPETGEATVDLLVTRTACDQFPLWRDELLTAGGRVWDLSHGPVARFMGHAVSPHLEHLAT